MAVKSASVPTIPGSGTSMMHEQPSQPAWMNTIDGRMPRSASYTNLPETEDDQKRYDDAPRPTFDRAKSDDRLTEFGRGRSEKGGSLTVHRPSLVPPPSQKRTMISSLRILELGGHKNGVEKSLHAENVSYDSTMAGATPQIEKPSYTPKKSIFKSSKPSPLEQSTVPYESTVAGAPPRMEARPYARSDAYIELTKKSTDSSRSPSIKNLDDEPPKVSAASINQAAIKLKNARQGIPSVNTSSRPSKSPERLSRKTSKSQKDQTSDPKKSMNGILRSFTSDGSSLSRSSSTLSREKSKDKLPSSSNAKPKSIPIVLNMSNDLESSKPTTKKRTDELARPIRALETEYEKFESGSISLKANSVRHILSPFLRDFAQHPSNKTLAPEDLDRRIKIFDKWWRGILYTLNADEACAVSWTDRHMLLEAVSRLMSRPEWRLAPSDCSPLKDRYTSATPTSSSSTSLDSDNEFLIESVHHNMRTMFVSNLLSQMAFAVSTLSQRTTPPSTVIFGGKTAAYVFFFCPGAAEIMIKLWKTPLKVYQRVLDEFGVPPRFDFSGKNEDIVRGFPRCLRALRYTSFGITTRWHRSRGDLTLPLSSDKIDWNGPWVTRWSGRDTDLFFIFVKHYHNLLSEFLPPSTGSREHICSPGFLQVHAQMLVTFDSTIQRKAPASNEPLQGPSPITFDDVLEGADTTAAALQLPLTDLAKDMAENRLIMLLREFLSEVHSSFDSSRPVFARTFSLLLKAAAKKTSMFDQTACFTLCEFMEEAFHILLRYQQDSRMSFDLVDWPFWQTVCQKMISSHNNMTEIRVFTFLYNIWGVLTKDEKRKKHICLDWLLTESTFENLFQHWCPMNRAYFMRLLCWRLARFDGDASEVDLKIYTTLFTRLRNLWAQFQCLKETLKALNIAPADTSPAPPAPGRKFLIIKSDFPRPTPGAFLEFEGINSGNSTPPTEQTLDDVANAKKSWKMLRSFIGMTDGTPPAPLPPPTIAEPSLRPKPVSRQNSKEKALALPASFKFSLDWLNKPQPASRPRILHPPRLPSATETLLNDQPEGAFESTFIVNPDAVLQMQSLKYAGRALAEWALVVGEYQGFHEKRLREGVASDKAVETPSLTIENFKRIGG